MESFSIEMGYGISDSSRKERQLNGLASRCQRESDAIRDASSVFRGGWTNGSLCVLIFALVYRYGSLMGQAECFRAEVRQSDRII